MEELKKFLTRHRCEKGEVHTHTSIANPAGSYRIPENDYEQFMTIYKRAMVSGGVLHMTEKPKNPSVMRSDLDFRFALPETSTNDHATLTRQYKSKNVEKIVLSYFQIMSKYLDVTPDKYVAVVLEKPHPVEHANKLKDGLHIIWPHLIVSNNFQKWVRKQVLDNATDVFKDLPITNTPEDVVDAAIIDRNNWQMYGSTKPKCDTYRVTRYYRYDPSENKLVDETASQITPEFELRFVDMSSMRQNLPEVPLRENAKEAIDEYIKLILPSVDSKRKTKLNMEIFGKTSQYTENRASKDEFELAISIIKRCLNKARSDNYEDWIKLGWVLHNIDHRLLDTWLDFSSFSAKYNELECRKMWDLMRNDTLGMGTLRWWAKKDNEQEYERILSESVMVLVDTCIGSSGAHFDVARVVQAMYKDAYRFTGKDCWYTYRPEKHRWVRSREGLQLRLLLSEEVVKKFMERSIYWSNEALRNQEQRSLYDEKSRKLADIATQLKKSSYKDGVMKECKCLFTDEKFEELLDSKPHLIGFENGVYDLRMHEFREGLPDDYISFCTGRRYKEYDPHSEDAKGVQKFFRSLFTNEGVRNYVLDILTSVLDGGIRQERFYVFTGSGCHAENTPIMMHDGTVVPVQNVRVGDVLMGDDHTPRHVQQLFRGAEEMYNIIPIKGETFQVNGNHILSLKFTNLVSISQRKDGYYKEDPHYRVSWFEYNDDHSCPPLRRSKTFASKEDAEVFSKNISSSSMIQAGDTIDIKVTDLLKWHPWWLEKGNIVLYKSNRIQFEEKSVDMDPYMLGYWLGDGHSSGPIFTTMNEEVVDYFKTRLEMENLSMRIYANKGKANTYGIRADGGTNTFLQALRTYNLLNNKHIPYIYRTASVSQRLELLAGILDSDGHYQTHCNQYELTLKNKQLMEDVVYLVRSLGLACYMRSVQKTCTNSPNGCVTGTYYRIQIYGTGIETIPCKLVYKCARARTKNKDALLDGFRIEKASVGNYYGFELDGNHRYLMGDFTVTHNSNGKSKLLELVQKAIGEYYCILPIALLTQKRAASNTAQSELERTRGRRFAVMQEPGENEKLNTGLMKELSGGDRILTRGLFKDPIEFRPQFKMILTCNELPEVQSDDGGTWRRIRVIEFTSKFVENPDPKKPNEFPIDYELSEHFDVWADTFISMIIHHHRSFDPKKMVEPTEVRIATEGYKKNNDVIGQYVAERVVADATATKRVLLNKMFSDFRTWAGQAMQKGKKLPDRNQFRAIIEKTHGAYPSDGKGWRNLRLLTTTEEDADSDNEN